MVRDEVAGHMRECARSSCDVHVSSSDDNTIHGFMTSAMHRVILDRVRLEC